MMKCLTLPSTVSQILQGVTKSCLLKLTLHNNVCIWLIRLIQIQLKTDKWTVRSHYFWWLIKPKLPWKDRTGKYIKLFQKILKHAKNYEYRHKKHKRIDELKQTHDLEFDNHNKRVLSFILVYHHNISPFNFSYVNVISNI